MKVVSLNLLNPKLTLCFFAFLPLAMSPATVPPFAELLQLSPVSMAITLVVFVGYGALQAKSSTRLSAHPKPQAG